MEPRGPDAEKTLDSDVDVRQEDQPSMEPWSPGRTRAKGVPGLLVCRR